MQRHPSKQWSGFGPGVELRTQRQGLPSSFTGTHGITLIATLSTCNFASAEAITASIHTAQDRKPRPINERGVCYIVDIKSPAWNIHWSMCEFHAELLTLTVNYMYI